jgi:hypothetical protein
MCTKRKVILNVCYPPKQNIPASTLHDLFVILWEHFEKCSTVFAGPCERSPDKKAIGKVERYLHGNIPWS